MEESQVHPPAGPFPGARPWRYRFHGQEDNSFPLMVTSHYHLPSWSSHRALGSPVLSGCAHLNILQPKQTNHASSSQGIFSRCSSHSCLYQGPERHFEASCPFPINSNSFTCWISITVSPHLSHILDCSPWGYRDSLSPQQSWLAPSFLHAKPVCCFQGKNLTSPFRSTLPYSSLVECRAWLLPSSVAFGLSGHLPSSWMSESFPSF